MYVIKRNGVKAPVVRDKIVARVRKLSYNLDISEQTINNAIDDIMSHLESGIHTHSIDKWLAKKLFDTSGNDRALATLAARIEASNLHKQTTKRFSTVHNSIYEDQKERIPLISEREHEFVNAHRDELDSAIISDRDFRLPYSTLVEEEENRLYRIDDKIIERPSHRYMRAAISVVLADEKAPHTLESVSKAYDDLSVQ